MIEYVTLGDYHTAVGFLLASPPDKCGPDSTKTPAQAFPTLVTEWCCALWCCRTPLALGPRPNSSMLFSALASRLTYCHSRVSVSRLICQPHDLEHPATS